MGRLEGGPVGRFPPGRGIHPGIAQPSAGGNAHFGSLAQAGTNLAGGLAVGQAQVKIALQCLPGAQLPAGGVNAGYIAQLGDALGLVQGHVGIHPALEVVGNDPGIPAEGGHNVPVQPAALVLQSAGQIPMVQRDHGLDAGIQQSIHQMVIEFQSLFVHGPVPVGDDPGPADGEPVSLNAKPLHQGHILRPAVVAVAGPVTGVAVLDIAGGVGEIVPDAPALPVLVPGALALIGSAGHAPEKIF